MEALWAFEQTTLALQKNLSELEITAIHWICHTCRTNKHTDKQHHITVGHCRLVLYRLVLHLYLCPTSPKIWHNPLQLICNNTAHQHMPAAILPLLSELLCYPLLFKQTRLKCNAVLNIHVCIQRNDSRRNFTLFTSASGMESLFQRFCFGYNAEEPTQALLFYLISRAPARQWHITAVAIWLQSHLPAAG